MPAPLSALVILKPAFNPGTQTIPRPLGLLSRQIGDDDPGLFRARLTADEHGAVLQAGVLVGKTGHARCPLLSACGQPVADPLPPIAAVDTDFGSQIDTQERMPALGHDLVIQPGGIQAPIS